MKKIIILTSLVYLLLSCSNEKEIKAVIAQNATTFCNPLDINYRFMIIDGGDGIREAADPVVEYFKGKYWLFASKSSGYWYSSDCSNWTHVEIANSVMPIEDYAPGTFIHNDYIYFVGSTHGKGMLYRSNAPETGKWEVVKEIWSYWDPAFYVEGDNLYMYYGCSPVDPIYAQVLDLNTLEAKSEVLACFNSNKEIYGWERTGEQNELPRRPYIEGAWMTKHNEKYYLQYAAPGTEWKSYADGVYVGDTPMGPFEYMEGSPVSYKPSGFVGGAGHGCMFMADGQYWKAATNAICLRHMFERRLSFFPSGFDEDGHLYTDTYLGDYPMFLPATDNAKKASRPDWMLLSYKKTVTASSTQEGFSVENIVDEEARTAWVASSNSDKEWVQIDLESSMNINAIQVNYDEYGATQKGLNPNLHQAYILYASHDGEKWYPIVDYSQKATDNPHNYIEFESSFEARYIKWENKSYTISDNVSLRELRIFGLGNGKLLNQVQGFSVERDGEDRCKAVLKWEAQENADGYIIRYGIEKDKLYNNFQVMDGDTLSIGSLNANSIYYFSIDAFNENGVIKGSKTIKTE